MITDKLLLDRWMGDAPGEDYIAWAVDLLVAGRDTPSLRILAGLEHFRAVRRRRYPHSVKLALEREIGTGMPMVVSSSATEEPCEEPLSNRRLCFNGP